MRYVILCLLSVRQPANLVEKMGQTFRPDPFVSVVSQMLCDNSVAELARFNLVRFELDDEGVSSLFGLELARLVVDTSYPELLAKQREIERQTIKSPSRR